MVFVRRHHSSAFDIFLEFDSFTAQLARMQCLRTSRLSSTLSRARPIPKLHHYRIAAMSTTTAGSDPLTAGLSAVPVQHEDKTVSPLKFADVGSQAQAFDFGRQMLSGCRLAST